VVELTPREEAEFRGNRQLAIQRQLAAPESQQVTVVKAIKTALDSMETGKSGKTGLSRQDTHRYDRRSAKQELQQILRQGELVRSGRRLDPIRIIENLGLPNEILSQPFSRLDNPAIKLLAQALMNGF